MQRQCVIAGAFSHSRLIFDQKGESEYSVISRAHDSTFYVWILQSVHSCCDNLESWGFMRGETKRHGEFLTSARIPSIVKCLSCYPCDTLPQTDCESRHCFNVWVLWCCASPQVLLLTSCGPTWRILSTVGRLDSQPPHKQTSALCHLLLCDLPYCALVRDDKNKMLNTVSPEQSRHAQPTTDSFSVSSGDIFREQRINTNFPTRQYLIINSLMRQQQSAYVRKVKVRVIKKCLDGFVPVVTSVTMDLLWSDLSRVIWSDRSGGNYLLCSSM